jgi:predicted nucleic acid-binding protein
VRVVLDTNILVRANPKVSPQGLARDLLLTIVSGPHVLILSSAILVEVSPAVVRDPDDDPILQTAILGRADILCTRDEAFRNEVVKEVCTAYSIKILDDISLLQELRRSDS